MDIVNVKRPLSQLHHSDDRTAADLQYEEHSGGATSSDVVMEANPAYQPLETAAADLRIGTM